MSTRLEWRFEGSEGQLDFNAAAVGEGEALYVEIVKRNRKEFFTKNFLLTESEFGPIYEILYQSMTLQSNVAQRSHVYSVDGKEFSLSFFNANQAFYSEAPSASSKVEVPKDRQRVDLLKVYRFMMNQ